MAKYKKVTTDPDKVYGDGDWRPVLGDIPRKRNIKFHMLGAQSVKDELRGAILPAFDLDLDIEDKSFPTSTVPCWSDVPDEDKPKHREPNTWAIPLIMYPYMGESKEHWISPKNLINFCDEDTFDPDDAADAFDDLNKWVRKTTDLTKDQKAFFLETDSFKEDPKVPGRSTRIVSLNECKTKEDDWHLAVVVYTTSAYSYIIQQGRWRHEEEDGEPIDKQWPRYLLGDFTRPDGALIWRADKIQLSQKDPQETNVMCFTKRREILDKPVRTREFSEELLAKRFYLGDPEMWNIPTYGEQVQHMVDHFDPAVTTEMIRAACGHRCDVPERKKRAKVSIPPEKTSTAKTSRDRDEDADDDTRQTRSMAPSTSAPPQPRDEDAGKSVPPPGSVATAPASKPAEEGEAVYWAGEPKTKPVKLTVAEIQERYDAGDLSPKFRICLDADANKWEYIEDSGLIELRVEEEAPPEVPDEEEPPAMPDDEAPAEVPDEDEAPAEVPAGDVKFTVEDLRNRIFQVPGSYDALVGDEKAQVDKLLATAYEHMGSGTDTEAAIPEATKKALMPFIRIPQA